MYVVCARVDVVATKLGIILSFSFSSSFFLLPSTYFSPRRGLPRKLKFGGWPNLTLTSRFSQKKNGVRDPPPQKKIPNSTNYFFTNSISFKNKKNDLKKLRKKNLKNYFFSISSKNKKIKKFAPPPKKTLPKKISKNNFFSI